MNEENQSNYLLKNQLEENDKNESLSPIKSLNNTNPQLFTEEKGVSYAFTQMLNNNQSNIPLPVSMDRNQLFETFLLFQKFININSVPPQNTQPNQFNISKSLDKSVNEEKENNVTEGHKDKVEPNALDTIIINKESGNHFTDNQSDGSRNNATNKISQNNSNIVRQGVLVLSEGMNQIKTFNNSSNNNYDEMPIKTSNANFIELVEKSLANAQSDNMQMNQNAKRKITKPVSYHAKKTLQVSKPSKTEKKYFYYTDKLDENVKLNDDRKTKTLRTEQSPLYHNTHHSIINGTNANHKQKNRTKDDDLCDENINIKTTQRYV